VQKVHAQGVPSLDQVPGSRDRVLDLTKSFALAVVVAGHALGWDVSTGTPMSILDLRPQLRWITWVLQILPLFFAAGAVSNLASWRRHPDSGTFWRRRLARLATPAVLYASVWTLLLLPLAVGVPQVEDVGRYLAQLLWFLGTYAAVVIAVPVTSRWARSPALTLALWGAAIVGVDVLRWAVDPTLGWLNMLLVWGWVHQLGYALPRLRTVRPALLVLGGASALAVAVALAVQGPYSTSMVSIAGDTGMSNLSPPSTVLAVYGLAQVLVLAALWPALDRLMAWRPAWLVVAGFGSRAIDVYLWHIPIVGVAILLASLLRLDPAPLGPAWWALHLVVVVTVLPLAWALAGPVGRLSRRLGALAGSRPSTGSGALMPAVLVSASVLAVSQTGFATWWGPGLVGVPMSSLPLLLLLVLAWLAISRPGGPPATPGATPRRATAPRH
jgi:hypothetical protein